MNIVCLDMEGVLVPEIWIAFAEATGIPELRLTTRDEPDYDKLMRYRIGILKEHGLGLGEIQKTIAGIDLMPGAREFLVSLRRQGVLLGVATCKLQPLAAEILGRQALAGPFTCIGGASPDGRIESKAQVPFPTALEVLGLLIAFEILQEAGVHLPQSLGQAVSIIGGLVVGSAAVEARLISPAALIVVAVAGVAGYVIPGRELANALRVWRFLLAGAACAAGLFGLSVAFLALLLHLGGLNTFGLGYLRPFDRGTTGGSILRRRTVLQPHTSQGGSA